MHGTVDDLRKDFSTRVSRLGSRAAAVDEIAALRYGPADFPVTMLLLLVMTTNPQYRADYLRKARFFLSEISLPADLPDLAGATPLFHCLEVAPVFNPEYAELLYQAGGDVNHRDRFGGSAAHQAAQIASDQQAALSIPALVWFVERGGNLDLRDMAGATGSNPRRLLQTCHRMLGTSQAFKIKALLVQHDQLREEGLGKSCAFCLDISQLGRQSREKKHCGKCRAVVYCSKTCQVDDWPHHKTVCSTLGP